MMEGKWSSLPGEILDMIAKRVTNTNKERAILCLRAVCSSWRSSIPRSENSPFQLSFIKPRNSTSDLNFPPFVLIQRTFLLISPLNDNYANNTGDDSIAPWIVQVVETGLNKLLLLDPCSGARASYFPKCAELPDTFNFFDYKITEIDCIYEYVFDNSVKFQFNYLIEYKSILGASIISLSFWLSCPLTCIKSQRDKKG